jgi:hypothetical protein
MGMGCKSGPRYKGGVYESETVRYRIAEPGTSWQPIAIKTADIAWYQERSGATLLVNSHCEGVDDAPLEALTQHLLMGTTERKILSQEKIPFAGREALETMAEAKLDGVVQSMRLFVLKKDGCVYDLVLASSPQPFDGADQAFKAVRDGLEVDPRPNRPEGA